MADAAKESVIGWVVELKSGGPLMTVIAAVRDEGKPEEEWLCLWFDQSTGSYKDRRFLSDSLRVVRKQT